MESISVYYRKGDFTMADFDHPDDAIHDIMQPFGAKRWASGYEFGTNIRDLAFDVPSDKIDDARVELLRHVNYRLGNMNQGANACYLGCLSFLSPIPSSSYSKLEPAPSIHRKRRTRRP